jgi:tetratricopeptide (TPR) repeat protein
MRRKIIRHIIVAIIGLFLISGCAVEIPWCYRADQKPIYVSQYFRVKPPVGRGWEAAERVPSDYFSNQSKYENDLFDEFIPQKIYFRKHAAKDLWPHPSDGWYTIGFYSITSDPERFKSDAKLMIEAEKEKWPQWEYVQTSWGKLKQVPVYVNLNEVTIENRKFFELAETVEGKVKSVKYIHFSKDLCTMFVIDLPFCTDTWGNLPKDVEALIESFEPIDQEITPTELAMERATAIVFDLTRTGHPVFVGVQSDRSVLWDRAVKDLKTVIGAEPDNYKAHIFLGGLYLLQNLDYAWYKEGLWDYYSVTDGGGVSNSLLLTNIDAEKALTEFQKAVKIKSSSFWANYYLAGIYLRQKDYEKAITQCQNLINYFPESSLSWCILGISYRESGNIKKALEAFQNALEKNKKDKVFVQINPIKNQIKTLKKVTT